MEGLWVSYFPVSNIKESGLRCGASSLVKGWVSRASGMPHVGNKKYNLYTEWPFLYSQGRILVENKNVLDAGENCELAFRKNNCVLKIRGAGANGKGYGLFLH